MSTRAVSKVSRGKDKGPPQKVKVIVTTKVHEDPEPGYPMHTYEPADRPTVFGVRQPGCKYTLLANCRVHKHKGCEDFADYEDAIHSAQRLAHKIGENQ